MLLSCLKKRSSLPFTALHLKMKQVQQTAIGQMIFRFCMLLNENILHNFISSPSSKTTVRRHNESLGLSFCIYNILQWSNLVPFLSYNTDMIKLLSLRRWGAQWLSGRVLDSRLRDSGFEPHWCHCSVVLEQDTSILA